jgi:hypothetical protein
MKFDPLVTYEKLLWNELTIVSRGSDGRYYVADADKPDEWHMSCHKFTEAVGSLNFTREFWEGKLAIADSPRTVRVGGVHYHIGIDNPDSPFKGFGGGLFLVQFNDGRRVRTNNMWCQGTIPSALRDKLPDNAVFITNEPGLHIEMWLQGGTRGTQAQQVRDQG